MRRAALALFLMLSGCDGVQNALGGQGAEGANFIRLFTLFMVVCTFMYVVICGAFAIAFWRRRREALVVDDRRHHEMSSKVGPALIVWTAIVVIGLAALTIASFLTDRSNAAIAGNPKIKLEVTANQWWWDVKYQTADSSRSVRTANEIHLPVDVAATVTLKSNDVIHSFWIPNLAGKQDLIPGRTTDAQLLPRKIGLYRGQCAEFCGVQHALMALDVTVESKADFQRWYAAQLQSPPTPTSQPQFAGFKYVTSRECSGCHNIAGTPASAQVAPDLTHFASRRSIAAGTMPMTGPNIRAWIADPQAHKPGNHMPTIPMAPNDLQAVTAYLESLK